MRLLILLFFLVFSKAGYSQTADDYKDRGDKKVKLKDLTGAIAEYTKAIQINPKHAMSYLSRASCKSELEDHRGAIIDYTVFISLFAANYRHIYNNEDYDAMLNLGFNSRGYSKFILRDYSGALLDYNTAISANPKDSRSYNQRGFVKILLNDKEGGCLDFSKAGELGYTKAYRNIKEYCN